MSAHDAKLQILASAKELLTLIVMLLIAPLALYIDLAILHNDIGEISVTELTQETLVAFAALLFALAAKRTPPARGFYLLAAGFFSCVLIRELDQLFDHVYHGFWLIPALLTAMLCIGYACLYCNDSIWIPLASFTKQREYVYMVGGLLMVLVFSRVFGSGRLLWEHIMGQEYNFVFKSALQEGLELLGYTWMSYAAYCQCWRPQTHTDEIQSSLTRLVDV
ncbi:hypothetical protein [Vibrio fluvialis]|uniref:hypothetical protein n=1 Tax=Vibrio fluvialis TaxID=676 RepID=UPI001302C722|nr:hypothetical protein [Vibrio fluvialis]ELV8593453.1 hypothetical protein [Vibrio fluvialis]ELV8646366.1 hypothetical protein [Vibrio fluvialis]MBY7808618.1 hypothetical protein [Vibrio fluvialis]MBY8026620.1 hypothetical protein [Vibrio fluvialis]MBY8069529.1 hypothetical protein [Vibrio fluvialis]